MICLFSCGAELFDRDQSNELNEYLKCPQTTFILKTFGVLRFRKGLFSMADVGIFFKMNRLYSIVFCSTERFDKINLKNYKNTSVNIYLTLKNVYEF